MDIDGTLKVLNKAEQVTRIFKAIYDERVNLYIVISRRWSFPRAKKAAKERLKTLNARERSVLNAIRTPPAILTGTKGIFSNKDFLMDIDRMHGRCISLVDLVQNIHAIEAYYAVIISSQEKFLDKEQAALDGGDWGEARKAFEEFTSTAARFHENVQSLDRDLISPAKIHETLTNNKNAMQALGEIVRDTGVFVLIFIGLEVIFQSNLDHKLFDPAKIPPIETILRFITFGSIIVALHLPERIVAPVLKAKDRILECMAVLSKD